MKIATIVGARPQFIKAAPVGAALRSVGGLDEVMIHTGQHYDTALSQRFFDELAIPAPAYNLEIGSGPHGQQTGRMLEAVEKALQEIDPDWVLVYGDTNSTLAGALAAAKLQIPVAHLEAGLRSFNRQMPEEVNRVATDHLSELLFAPTEAAVGNLHREGIAPNRVVQVGDVMYDAVLQASDSARKGSTIVEQERLGGVAYVLATIHRQENTDVPSRLRAIVDGLDAVAKEMPVVMLVHPRTQAALEQWGIDPAVRMLGPTGYLDTIQLEKHAALIATDSGGIQKEAFFHGVPCVTLRDETEWVELVELGWNRLCPPDDAPTIAQTIRESIGTQGRPAAPYGDGTAALKIAQVLSKQ